MTSTASDQNSKKNEPTGSEEKLSSPEALFTGVSVATVAGLVTIFIFRIGAPTLASYFATTAVAISASGAALLVGGLIGFLFGIPRSRQIDQPVASEASSIENSSPYAPNTNLEQISDWLTKILVGVGLTQIPQILSTLNHIGDAVAIGLGGGAGAESFATAIIIYFGVAGLLLGYLWTSLYLGRALSAALRSQRLEKQLTKLELQSQADANALRITSLQISSVEPQQSQVELDRAIAAATGETRAHIFYRAQAHHARNWREDATKPLMERTIPIFRALANSDVEQKYHSNHGLLGYALKDKLDQDWSGAKDELSQAIGLRDSYGVDGWNSYEANRAICSIALDEQFKAGAPSSEARKADIVSDLRWALRDEWVKSWAPREKRIAKWLDLNGLTADDLIEL